MDGPPTQARTAKEGARRTAYVLDDEKASMTPCPGGSEPHVLDDSAAPSQHAQLLRSLALVHRALRRSLDSIIHVSTQPVSERDGGDFADFNERFTRAVFKRYNVVDTHDPRAAVRALESLGHV